MRKGTKIVLFIGLGILAAGILLGGVTFAFSGFRVRTIPFVPGTSSAGMKTEKLEFKEAFSNIDISVPSAEVTIYESEDNVARIEYTAQVDDMEYEAYVKDDTLVFRRTDSADGMQWTSPSQVMENLENLLITGNILEKKLDLYLPKKAYQKLAVSTASGEIFSDKAFSVAEASLTSVSGEITLSNLKDAKTVSVVTTSGEISASNMDIKSDMSALSTSGEITLDQISVSGSMNAASTSGDIRLSTGAYEETNLETVSGEIIINDITSKMLSAYTISGEVTGTIDAATNVHASSISGSIHVPTGNKDNWNINTTSGDIDLRS